MDIIIGTGSVDSLFLWNLDN